jgi:hypoxanthine phosphoribosyltransferase
MELWALAIERIVAVLRGGWFTAQIVAFVLLRQGYGSSKRQRIRDLLSGSRRIQLDRYRRSLVVSLVGMTLSS